MTTTTGTARYGTAVAQSWDRLHPRLTHRAAWEDHDDGKLPIIEGTLIRLQVDHLPGDRDPKPVWLWSSRTGASPQEVDRLWQAFLRRFDLEHTFRLFKQVLGWTAPKIRDAEAADRWTWLIIACHAQLRLARDLAADLRRPWERPALPGRLTPARVRRGFRNIRAITACPAGAPKPGKPGPGRPPAPRTAARQDATTWARTANKARQSRSARSRRVKRQAKDVGVWVKELEPGHRMLWWDRNGEYTWEWLLEPEGGRTRLINRVRVTRHPWTRRMLYELVAANGDIVMMRKMLRGIKQRAERLTAGQPAPATDTAAS